MIAARDERWRSRTAVAPVRPALRQSILCAANRQGRVIVSRSRISLDGETLDRVPAPASGACDARRLFAGLRCRAGRSNSRRGWDRGAQRWDRPSAWYFGSLLCAAGLFATASVRLAEAVGPIRRGPFSPIAPMDGLAAADQRVVCAETDVNAERLPPPGEEATGDDSSTASN